MFIEYDSFKQRADALLQRIGELCLAAGRRPAEVILLPVTKTHPAQAAEYAWRHGFKAVGENRVQEAVEKIGLAGPELRWELIGHLQSNKAKLAAAHFSRIQSVDSSRLLDALDQAAAGLGRKIPVLLQINAGLDPAKFGVAPDQASQLMEHALRLSNLQVDGLMTVAPLSDDPAVARRTFAALRLLRDELQLRFGCPLSELSMGMSADLGEAIAEGSTLVRVGSALYGRRI